MHREQQYLGIGIQNTLRPITEYSENKMTNNIIAGGLVFECTTKWMLKKY